MNHYLEEVVAGGVVGPFAHCATYHLAVVQDVILPRQGELVSKCHGCQLMGKQANLTSSDTQEHRGKQEVINSDMVGERTFIVNFHV